MKLITKTKSTFKSCSQTWDNKDGYVQPMISFRGVAVLVLVIATILIAAAING